MTRWPIKKLGDLVDFVGGGTPRRDRPDYWGGAIPWASVKDLQSQSLETTVETITPEGLTNSASNLIPKGTVIIASRVGLGKVAINRKPVAINQDLKALRPRSDEILPLYLLQFLLLKAEYFERAGVGATVKGLTIADYQKLEIAVPPLVEQERIAKLLGEADELRKLRSLADMRTAKLVPALFHEMFGDPARNQKGWPRRRLRDLSIKFSDGPFGSNLKSSHYTAVGVRVIRLQNIGVGSLVDTDKAYISLEHFATLKKHECLPGDVIVGTLGDPNLRACVLPRGILRALNKADCVQIRVDPDVATAEFVCWLLNLPTTLEMAAGMILGQTRARISMGRLAELLVPLPPLPLQKQFAERVAEARELESEQAKSGERIDGLFQSMLHGAFSGGL